MTALGGSKKNIELMERYMKDNVASFVPKEIIPASRGQVEISIPSMQSG
ncbi:hypothetical protein PBAL39_15729 [Pedobacter sp. BAL39]|nr:hypothetical protein [Pedobacter sp. BAL39]EDM37889.1 hypothetical protein PBAL39_15729 [Pedobacter sp. BAL39]